MTSDDRPFVDGMNIHDVERIEIKAHADSRCLSISLTGTDGAYSTFTINIWSRDHLSLPKVVIGEGVSNVKGQDVTFAPTGEVVA
jgi:hypothetical protein